MPMTNVTRVHLTFVLDEAALPIIAAERHRWDPAMATGVPPHVTLVYPEEFNDHRQILVDRAEDAAAMVGPFALHLDGLVTHGDRGESGVFAAVSDPTGSWQRLRQTIVRPPLEPRDVAPHVTVVHPRTSDRGAAAWSQLQGSAISGSFVVREFCLTSTSVERGMVIEQRFKLTGKTM